MQILLLQGPHIQFTQVSAGLCLLLYECTSLEKYAVTLFIMDIVSNTKLNLTLTSLVCISS